MQKPVKRNDIQQKPDYEKSLRLPSKKSLPFKVVISTNRPSLIFLQSITYTQHCVIHSYVTNLFFYFIAYNFDNFREKCPSCNISVINHAKETKLEETAL